jgi:hypothetical protein
MKRKRHYAHEDVSVSIQSIRPENRIHFLKSVRKCTRLLDNSFGYNEPIDTTDRLPYSAAAR